MGEIHHRYWIYSVSPTPQFFIWLYSTLQYRKMGRAPGGDLVQKVRIKLVSRPWHGILFSIIHHYSISFSRYRCSEQWQCGCGTSYYQWIRGTSETFLCYDYNPSGWIVFSMRWHCYWTLARVVCGPLFSKRYLPTKNYGSSPITPPPPPPPSIKHPTTVSLQ